MDSLVNSASFDSDEASVVSRSSAMSIRLRYTSRSRYDVTISTNRSLILYKSYVFVELKWYRFKIILYVGIDI